jgi:predicted glutamine amidotransferase
MCELLAVSTSRPTRLTFSLHTLAARGSPTGGTRDGWGVAFYQGEDVALFRQPGAAGDSALVRYLESDGPPTTLAISHIRHATQGAVQLSNTQPFVRQVGGRTHVFAHNGNLAGIDAAPGMEVGAWQPVGQTDSERAFCALLARIGPWWGGMDVPPLEQRLAVIGAFAADLRRLGPANFLYADGDALFAHAHRRMQPALGRIEPPGLWTLRRHCADANEPAHCQGGVAVRDGGRMVLCVASVPLTDEPWRPLAEGELLAARDGELLATRMPAADGETLAA